MEIAVAIVVAVSSALIFAVRALLTWGLATKALQQGANLEISGLNPLAPTVRINEQPRSAVPPRRTTNPSTRRTTRRSGAADSGP